MANFSLPTLSKKLGLFLISVLATSLLTTACGDATNSPASSATSTSPAASSGPVTVTVWSKDRHTADVMREAVTKFNKENPAVQIDYVLKGDDMDQLLNLAFASKQAPDIFTPINDIINTGVAQGFIMPLENTLSKETYDAYRPYLQNGVHILNGKTYFIPMGLTTARLIYNKNLFRQAGLDPEKPPTTYSQLKEYAKKITEATNGETFGFGLPLNWAGYTEWGFEPLVIGSNPNLTRGGLFNYKENRSQAMSYKPAIELYRELVKNKWVYPKPGLLDNDKMREEFAKGKIGMFVAASWDVGVFSTQFKTEQDWAAAPLPAEDGKTLGQVPAAVGSVQWARWAGSKNPAAVAKVMEYLLSAELSQKLQKGGYINALHPAARSPEFFPQVRGAKEFAPNDKDLAEKPHFNGYVKIEGKSLNDVVTELMLSDESLDSALADLDKRTEAAYKKAVSSGKLDPQMFLSGN